jgi:hypothetical protein
MLFCKTSQASLLYKSLACSLVSFISGLWWVSLAEYLLILRALFPLLLQKVRCTMGIASTVCTRWWATTRTNGNGHSVYLIPYFCGLWLPAGTVFELSVYVVLKLLASAMLIWTRVNFMFWTPMYSTVVANFMYHVTVAAKSEWSWLECWLVRNPSWFHEISGCTSLSLVNYLPRWKIFLLNLV